MEKVECAINMLMRQLDSEALEALETICTTLRESTNSSHNSDYAVSPSAKPKLPSFLSVCVYITENNMATSFESFYFAIKKLGNFE